MLKKTALIVALLIASPAFAQAPPLPVDPVATLTEEWNVYMNAQRHVMDALNGMAKALGESRAENAKLKTELEALKKPPESKPPEAKK